MTTLFKNLLVLSLIFLVGSCQRQEKNSSTKTLKISFATSPTTLDPRKCGDFSSSMLSTLLFEGLMRCDGGNHLTYGLAERVEVSSDQKTYRFYLRKSSWNDGRPVTAIDFERSWKSALTPTFTSPMRHLLYPIRNAEMCAKGLVGPEEIGVHSLSETILEVDLERPTPYFLSLTASSLYFPVPNDFDNKVTNGPFYIENISPNTEIVLTKNSTYWNATQILLDHISIAIVADEMTAFQMFERKQLDLLGGPLAPLPMDCQSLISAEGKLQMVPMAASSFCSFNTQSFPFQNRYLRSAFSLAIDRDQIVAEVAQKGQCAATRCIPPALLQTKEDMQLFEHNEEKARTILALALQELAITRSDLNRLTLYYKSGQVEKRIAQALQKQWEKVLGIQIQIEQLDPKTCLQRLHEKQYQIALTSWIAHFDDPLSLLERLKNKDFPKNYPGWGNDDYVRLLNLAGETQDPQKRSEIFQKAEQLIAGESVIAPLYHWSAPLVFHPHVENFTTTSSGCILFEKIYLQDSYR